MIQDLIYNEPTKLVSKFKDYLIFDDINEFLKRTYIKHESKYRLPLLAQFYGDKFVPSQTQSGNVNELMLKNAR